MKELMKELSVEEMGELKGGNFTENDGGNAGSGGYSSAQCAYFLSLCMTGAAQFGCGDTRFNCKLYNSGC